MEKTGELNLCEYVVHVSTREAHGTLHTVERLCLDIARPSYDPSNTPQGASLFGFIPALVGHDPT